MTSKAQPGEARQSAGGSTGPKSAEGKARSRLNATKHGLGAQAFPERFKDEIGKIVGWLSPAGATHDVSFDAAISHHRVAYVRAIKLAILARAAADFRAEHAEGASLDDDVVEAEALIRCLDQLAKLDTYQRRAYSVRRKAFRRLFER